MSSGSHPELCRKLCRTMPRIKNSSTLQGQEGDEVCKQRRTSDECHLGVEAEALQDVGATNTGCDSISISEVATAHDGHAVTNRHGNDLDTWVC